MSGNRKVKATLVEVYPLDGSQRYELNEPHPTLGGFLWLTGWNQAEGVKVGDRGVLEYRSTRTQGLWWFVKDEVKAES